MDGWDVALLVVVLVGVGLVAFAPPDPQYSLSASVAGDETPEDVRSFESLGEGQRELFISAVEDKPATSAEPPGIGSDYVRFDGTVYRVRTTVAEGPVLSVLLPLVGQWVAFLGGLGVVGRRGWRVVRSQRA